MPQLPDTVFQLIKDPASAVMLQENMGILLIGNLVAFVGVIAIRSSLSFSDQARVQGVWMVQNHRRGVLIALLLSGTVSNIA